MAALLVRQRAAPLLLLLFGCLSFLEAVSVASAAGGNIPNNNLPSNFRVIKPQFGRRDAMVNCEAKNKTMACTAVCPRRCRNECIGLCPDCKTYCACEIFPGTVCGDPRFTGADGNIFYFHGKKDQDFCILSDNNFHINAHFIGKHNPNNDRDFTWIQALGIIFGDNNYHKLYIGVEKTMTWDNSVDHLIITFDGESVEMPAEAKAKWVPAAETAPLLTITRTSDTNGIMIELRGVFTIIGNAVPITKKESDQHSYGITPEDSLAHLDLSFKFHGLSDDVHGVLGQTYRPDYVNKLDVRKNMPIMTGAANYSSSTIFSLDCAVARFHAKPQIAMVTEKALN